MAIPLQQLRIPDFLSILNLPSNTNPHEDDVRAETEEWVSRHTAFTETQWNQLLASDVPRFASRLYPYAGHEELRICCDFSFVVFTIDDVADDEDQKQGSLTCTTSIDVMQNHGVHLSSRNPLLENYRSRLFKLVGPTLWRRIGKDWEANLLSLPQELDVRESNKILSIEEYIPLRRENVGARLCFSHIEYALGFELPDEVYENPVFNDIYLAAVDMFWVSNDVYSYEKERRKGHGSWNFVSVLMHEHSIDVQAAADHAGVKFRHLVDRFMSGKANLPSWGGAIDSNVAAFVEGLGIWVVGYLHWCFETPRYFGPGYEKVKHTLTVNIGL